MTRPFWPSAIKNARDSTSSRMARSGAKATRTGLPRHWTVRTWRIPARRLTAAVIPTLCRASLGGFVASIPYKYETFNSSTQIRFQEQTVGSGNTRPIRVDPVNNLLIVPRIGETRNDLPALLIFDRKASGNSKPLRVIRGPKTQVAGGQQMAVSPKGWIVGGARGNSIGVWSVFDDGDVPPRWRIPVKQISGLNVNGIALDPAHQELMVPTGNGNTVMTFYFPEIF